MAKKFGKITIIYAVGQILSKLISFILIPLYTNKLGTDGYGQLALADMMYSLIVNVIAFQITAGYTRYYYDYDDEKRKQLKDTAISFAILCSIGFIFVNLVFGKYYSGLILDMDNSYIILLLLTFMASTEQIAYVLMLDFSMKYNAIKVVNYQIMKLVLNLLFVIYYVAYKSAGIVGMYKGYCISNLLILIIIMFMYKIRVHFYINMKMLKKMFVYSVQLVPTNIAAIVLNLADRYVLSILSGIATTGIYSLGTKFGMLIQPLVIEPFKKVFTPYKYEVWKEEDANNKLNQWFIKYNILGFSILFQISIWVKLIIMITSPEEFIKAYTIVPLIAFSYFIYGKGEFYSLGIYVNNKTRYVAYIMAIAGMVNIVLNFTFIPVLGMYGAAIATIISQVISNKLFEKASNSCCDFRYKNNKKVKLLYCYSIALYLVYFFFSTMSKNFELELINVVIINLIWILLLIKFDILKEILDGRKLKKLSFLKRRI